MSRYDTYIHICTHMSGFLDSALLTFGAGLFFAMQHKLFTSFSGLYPLGCQWHCPSQDNKKCPQTLLSVPWGKIAWGVNH
jgi:hypothetical protein